MRRLRKLALQLYKKHYADVLLQSQIFTVCISRNLCYTSELLGGNVAVKLSCPQMWHSAGKCDVWIRAARILLVMGSMIINPFIYWTHQFDIDSYADTSPVVCYIYRYLVAMQKQWAGV